MTTQPTFELPQHLDVLRRQNLETWRRLNEMKPLLDLLAASKDPKTEAARQDLVLVLEAIHTTTSEILRRQSAMEAQLQEMAATVSALKPFLARMTRHLP